MTPPPKLYIIIKQIVFSKNTNYVVFLFFLGREEGGEMVENGDACLYT
jgi:hypothetical protein